MVASSVASFNRPDSRAISSCQSFVDCATSALSGCSGQSLESAFLRLVSGSDYLPAAGPDQRAAHRALVRTAGLENFLGQCFGNTACKQSAGDPRGHQTAPRSTTNITGRQPAGATTTREARRALQPPYSIDSGMKIDRMYSFIRVHKSAPGSLSMISSPRRGRPGAWRGCAMALHRRALSCLQRRRVCAARRV